MYAKQTLKVGDKVDIRIHTDIDPGTVVKVTKTRATVRLHDFKCVNLPKSGAADAMTFTPGGFSGHMSGTQRNEVDFNSNRGEVVITWRKGDLTNGTVGAWRRAGYPGGRGKLGGIVYEDAKGHHDFNF